MLVTRVRRRVRAAACKAGLAGAGLIFVLAAAAFLLVALHIALSHVLGPITSALFIAASLLIVGLVLLLIASRGSVGHAGAEGSRSGLLGGTGAEVTRGAEHRSILHDATLRAAGIGLLAGLLIRKRRRRRR